jgi:hypothetical protein
MKNFDLISAAAHSSCSTIPKSAFAQSSPEMLPNFAIVILKDDT